MKISQEIYDAVREVCIEYGQGDELAQMIVKAVEGKLDDSYSDGDLKGLIRKVKL